MLSIALDLSISSAELLCIVDLIVEIGCNLFGLLGALFVLDTHGGSLGLVLDQLGNKNHLWFRSFFPPSLHTEHQQFTTIIPFLSQL